MPSSLSGWVHIYSYTQYRNWPPWRNSLSYKDIDSLHQHGVVVLNEMHGNTGILANIEKMMFPCWLRWGVVDGKLHHWRNWFAFLGSQSLIKYIRAPSLPSYFSPLFVHLPVGGIHWTFFIHCPILPELQSSVGYKSWVCITHNRAWDSTQSFLLIPVETCNFGSNQSVPS